MKLSIVIPAYNVEKYIARCLSSLDCQLSNNDIEVIVVNDGSSDNTLEIANSFAKKKSFFKVISQENQGLSMARNIGLKRALGEYVWFVDSDDWIVYGAINKILGKLASSPDVVAINYALSYEDGRHSSSLSFSKKQIKCRNGVSLLRTGFHVQAQFYIYKCSFLDAHKLQFYPGIFHEDIEFTPRVLYYASKILFIEDPLYHFYKRSNSITTTANPKRSYDYITVADSLRTFVIQNRSAYDKYLYRYVGRAVCNAMRVAGECDKNDQNEFIKFFSKDVQNSFVSSLLRTVNWKYMFIGCLFMLCPQKSVYIYNRFLKR